MPKLKNTAYHSYLLRCWVSVKPTPGNGSTGRFVVEHVSNEPQRWGFHTFDELVVFLRMELLGTEGADRSMMEDK